MVQETSKRVKKGQRSRRVVICTAYIIGIVKILVVSFVPFVLLQKQIRVDQHLHQHLTAVTSNTDTKSTRNEDTQNHSPRPNNDIVHLVFSTDCSGYQHWQGIALWYAAQSAGHPGPVSRMASGCSNERRRREIAAEWDRIDQGRGMFRVHFTPDMQMQGNYKYSNKPGGLKHWLANSDPPIEQEFIMLLDPDMMPLLPITTRLGAGLHPIPRRTTKQVEYVDTSTGVARILRVDDADLVELTDYVRKGRPAGQHFGLGGTWAFAPSDTARYQKWTIFSKARVCGEGSPCTLTSVTDAKKKYAVGPVYLAHIDDWRHIADAWWGSMGGVHAQHPYLLAEMFALTMAVANLTLPWTLVSNYMVTGAGVSSPTESWSWIDDIFLATNASAVCAGASTTSLPFATRNRTAIALPATLHYCQRYMFAGHLFAKRKVPHDFFRCDGEYLPFDIDSIMRELSSGIGTLQKTDIRNAFMICHLIPMMNSALDSYKRDVCTT